MGKLNIAHHKSYHPYRRDNIKRVRRDEEKARLEEEGKKDEARRIVSRFLTFWAGRFGFGSGFLSEITWHVPWMRKVGERASS